MQKFKRFLAGLLTLVMLFTSVPVQAFAVQDNNNAEASMDTQDVDFEGTSAVGTLLAEAIAEEQQSTIVSSEETPYEDGYTLTDIVVQGSVATVTYDALEEAQLVVALYTEDGMQLLNTAKTTVSPENTTATVTFSGEMPQYFLAAAYLLDVYDFSPLCPSYETPMYTQDMQELLAMTVEDCVEEYGEERIYNLDDNSQTNFAVYAEGTVLLYEEPGVNTVASVDDVNLVYVIENADERVTSLTEGCIVVYEYADGELLLMKVSTITVDGTIVTIQGMDMEIEEVFAIMKVEGDSAPEDAIFEDINTDECIEYLGPSGSQTYSARAVEGGGSATISHKFYLWGGDQPDSGSTDTSGGTSGSGSSEKVFEGTLTLSLTTSVDFYISTKRQYVEFKLLPRVALEVTVGRQYEKTFKSFTKITIPVCYGVKATAEPALKFKFEGKLSVAVTTDFQIGFALEHRPGEIQCKDLSTKPVSDFYINPELMEINPSIDITAFFGICFNPGLEFLSSSIAQGKVNDEIGLELDVSISASTDDHDKHKGMAATIHDCSLCIDGALSFVVRAGIQFQFLKSKSLTFNVSLLELKFKLLDFYWSLDNVDFGKGDCPNLRYRVYVNVKDRDMEPVEGAEVYFIDVNSDDGKKIVGTTNANGLAVNKRDNGDIYCVYLPQGFYTFETIVDGEPIRSPEPVEVYTYTSTVLTSNEEYWRRQAKLKLLMIAPDDTSASSILDSDPCGNTLNWRMWSNGLLEIYGEGAMDSFSSASKAPWYKFKDRITSVRIGEPLQSTENVDTSKLITISANAFSGYTNLKKVILEDSVKSVSYRAFYNCTGLKILKLPVDIDIYQYDRSGYESSFAGCTNITNIHYTYGLTGKMTERSRIGANGWDYKETPEWTSHDSLTGVYFDEGITDIASRAFSDCDVLTSAAIPSSVTVISSYAFYGCNTLRDVALPVSLTTLGEHAFHGCWAVESIDIPVGITSIPACCFSGCKGLKKLIIPDSVKSLSYNAFANCTGVTKVTMPVDLDVYQYTGKGYEHSFNGTVNVSSILYTYGQTGKMTNRQRVNANGWEYTDTLEYASKGALKSVYFDDRISDIKYRAFSECDQLVTAEIPAAVTSIGEYAFYGCNNLGEIKLPSGLTSLGQHAFHGCGKLTSIEIPDSVTSIGTLAFKNCTGLKTVKLPVDVYLNGYTDNYQGPFQGCTNVEKIHYTKGQTGEMPNRTSTAASYYYLYNITWSCKDSLKEVVLDEGITKIGYYAFYDTKYVTDITIPSTVTFIGGYAFYNNANLTNMELPDQLDDLREYAFYGCASLKEINLSEKLTSIPERCFQGCSGLTSVEIPDSVTYINKLAFKNCTGLKTVKLPVDIGLGEYTTDYQGPFQGCTNVEKIHYTKGQTGIMPDRSTNTNRNFYQYNLTWNCKDNLKTLIIGEGVTSIGTYACYQCTGLSNIIFLGDSLTIASNSFSGVTADALYPFGNETWTESVMQNYGGKLTWMPYILDEDGNIITDFDPISGETEPEETEPEETEPEETEPEVTEPEETEPEETDPLETEPEETDPDETEAGETEPEETESEETEPDETKAGETEPEETNSGETEPQETVLETISEEIPSSASAEPEVVVPDPDSSGQTQDPAANAVYGGMNEAEFEELTGAVVQSTYFSGLVPGSEYVMFALVSMEAADLLAPENILYIGQKPADDNGALTFRYIQREATDNFNVFACGASHRHLRNASITFPKMEDNGELRIAEPTVTYDGETLIENVDYVVLDGQGAKDAGEYLCTIRGICNYTGLITCSYLVDAAYVEPEIEKIDLSGTAMTLCNSLSMDFAVNVAKLANNGEGHYALITKHYADGRADVVTRIEREEWKVYSGTIYTASCSGIAAKEMCDEVEVVFYNADGYAVTNTYTDSVKSYAMRTLNNTANQSKTKLLTTIVDMLNYGAAAQQVFGYDTENLANADLTEAQQAMATTEINPSDARVKGPGYAGSTLTLESQILLDFVFFDSTLGTDLTDMYAIAAYTDHYGKEKEIRLDEFKLYASGLHYVSVSGMAVADCSSVVSCTIYNSNGQQIASASDSVEGYIARQLASGRTDEIYNAILKFAASAYNYFH